MATALTSGAVIRGDTLLLRGGTYSGEFTCVLDGSPAQPITIRPYPSEVAIIDGGITVGTGSGDAGSYINIRCLFIENTNANRGTWETPDGTQSRATALDIHGNHVNLINNQIYDTGTGIGHWDNAYGGLVYGNIVLNCGWADDNQGGCESIYIQGDNKIIKHNVFGPAFKRTFAAYGNNSALTNSTILENAVFARQGLLVGSGNVPVNNVTVDLNHIVGDGFVGGYTYNQNGSLLFMRNRSYAPAGKAAQIMYFQTLNSNRNVLVGSGADPNHEMITVRQAATPGDWTLNNNAYHYLGAAKPFGIDGAGFYTFAEWQALGYDAVSTYSTALPVANEIFVYPNEYPDPNDKRMGMVVIWNWEGLDPVSVNLAGLGLTNGTTYRWRQAQDPLVDTDTFVADGNPVSFATSGHTVTQPLGFAEDLMVTMFPIFGVFVIEKL